MYASLCDFVCIALLLPFARGFCLSVFGGFVFWVGCSLLSFFLFLIIIFYFNNFILFIYLFFLPFLLSRVADRVLVLRPGVRPVPLRWESQVHDICPPETSQLHVILNSESSPRDRHLNAKTQLHSKTSKLQCWTPYAKQLARQEHNHTH